MIVGVGIDLTPVSRMAESITRHGDRVVTRLFTHRERAFCEAKGQPAQHYAARFAVKEATLKAMGVPDGLSWHQMEVLTAPDGRPELCLTGAAEAAAKRLGATRWLVTITHAGDMAAAVVILES